MRRASIEENLTLSGWLEDLVKGRADVNVDPKRGYLDLTDHPIPPENEDDEPRGPDEDDDDYEPSLLQEPVEPGPPPTRRYRDKGPQDIEDYVRVPPP